jgi:hypothetical protein
MGDRVSISFVNKESKFRDESVVFFSHWDGMQLVKDATEYVKKLDKEVPKEGMYPITRREPNTVMVDFLREFFQNETEHIKSNYYLGKDKNDGDNSDNGHHQIEL